MSAREKVEELLADLNRSEKDQLHRLVVCDLGGVLTGIENIPCRDSLVTAIHLKRTGHT